MTSDLSISRFWEAFLESREGLLHPADSEAMSGLLETLRLVDRRFYYHVGEHDDGADLILSAEGHCDALPLLQRVRDHAPEVPGWKVLAVFDGDLTIGRRNAVIFPEDENGDVLYRMARSGDNLCSERAINFSVVFPSASARREFLESLGEEGLEGKPEEGNPDYEPWDVTVTQVMLPTHENITTVTRRPTPTLATGGTAAGPCLRRRSSGCVVTALLRKLLHKNMRSNCRVASQVLPPQGATPPLRSAAGRASSRGHAAPGARRVVLARRPCPCAGPRSGRPA